MKKISPFKLGFVLLSTVVVAGVVYSAPPGSPYNRGETLAPTCAPGDTNCTVTTTIAVSDLATGTAGQIITWDAAGDPATLSTGTSGQVLTSNGAGAAPTFQNAGGGSNAYTQTVATLTTTDATLTQLAAVSIAEGNTVWIKADISGTDTAETGRYHFGYSGLFYRDTGGNVSQEKGALGGNGLVNDGGPVVSSSGLKTFGDSTTEFNITYDGQHCTYTWSGNGTAPNFATNGMYIGATLVISGTNFSPGNQEGGVVESFASDYVSATAGPGCTDESGVTIGAGSFAITVPGFTFSLDTANQTIDVNVIGKPSTTINWKGIISSFVVSS